jgi:peptide methionine sulfoxide reductase
MHQRAVLAGGCFWGMQDLIRKLPGVVSICVGYMSENPASYKSPSRNVSPGLGASAELLDYIELGELYLASFGENGCESIAIGVAA